MGPRPAFPILNRNISDGISPATSTTVATRAGAQSYKTHKQLIYWPERGDLNSRPPQSSRLEKTVGDCVQSLAAVPCSRESALTMALPHKS
jgi:hypothetical protein